MLIIFDLDDTLIDTSGSITPHRLRSLVTTEGEYQQLCACNEKAPHSKGALLQFAIQKGWDDVLIRQAMEKLFSPLPDSFPIALTLGAHELLTWLAASPHTMALVTGGNPFFQMDKLRKSGIASFPLQSVWVAEDSRKKNYYHSLVHSLGIPPQEVLVCGDRPEMDLRPAYELGFRVFLRRWGRGLRACWEPWMEGEVENLWDLVKVIR